MVRMVALQPFDYGVPLRRLKVGEEFEVEEKWAPHLRALNRATDAPEKTYETRDVKPDDESRSEKRSAGRYRRSDMRAED